MKIMNQLLGICGLGPEETFSPEDEKILHELEAEYEAQEESLSPEDEEILQVLDGEYKAHEKAERQKRREQVVLGRWNQLLLRGITGMVMLLAVPCIWHQCSIWSVLEMWIISELLWCGVREFNKIGDFVIHELAVISGVLLAVILQSPEKVLYAFGLSCMSAVLLSNNLGLRMWQGKPVRYCENIAGLFLMLCTVITIIFYYFR